MPRYKALPAELDPCARQLVARLRQLKDHGELTMRHLAAKTGYSAKSWERYLAGTSLPPGEAVEALARITGADPVALLALHEIAADTWDSRRTGPIAQPQPQPQPTAPSAAPAALTPPPSPTTPTTGPAPGRLPHIALTTGVVALTVALSATVLLMLRLDEDIAPAAVAAAPTTAEASPRPSYTCRIARLDGHWSAGVNDGRNTEIYYGDTGADVAEAQCLLRRAGISPGGIDGMFGPLTLRAVKTFQQREGLVADGMLGPRSWKALRG
ncbi:peptidoglycan-binding protein [Streptomyces sp. NBC_00414]|uniref:peptidoglycan-binding protein n=1 Tax=Streptomyces sp. NBC_00414 TaxID=2975739 RepID=UPI002E24193B